MFPGTNSRGHGTQTQWHWPKWTHGAVFIVHRLKALIILQVCVHLYVCKCEQEAYLCIGPGASIIISGQEAKACLLVKLPKKSHLKKLVCGQCWSREKETRVVWQQLHTYMNDVWVGVPVIGANKKVDQELRSVFLIQLGNDVLQPPCFACRAEKDRKVR